MKLLNWTIVSLIATILAIHVSIAAISAISNTYGGKNVTQRSGDDTRSHSFDERFAATYSKRSNP